MSVNFYALSLHNDMIFNSTHVKVRFCAVAFGGTGIPLIGIDAFGRPNEL
jgi:hypothetical protein